MMTHMQPFGFMWGNFEPEAEPVLTVRLSGFDSRQVQMTGRRDVLWREFFTGDGGQACQAARAGFALWSPQGKD